MAASTTRWLCLLRPLFLLLLLQSSRVTGQLTLGSADSFLPEHLDANAVTTTGKTIEVTPLSDASVTNAAVVAAADPAVAETASELNLQGASQADYLFTTTDSQPEETTLPDFDDYTVDETERTTESFSPENDVTEPGEADLPDYLADGEQGNEEATTASSSLTRRIVFTGPDVQSTTPLPPIQSTRPSSVVRELDDRTIDLWRPNWPSQLLESTKDFRSPSIRFPTGPAPTASLDTTVPSPTTTTPSYIVTKVPVTQYYFDLASVTPTTISGPLFDREDVGVSSSAVPSVYPDLTQPLESEDLSASISELQSSVLVDAEGPPVTSTPVLPHSTPSPVIANEAHHSITPTISQTLPLTSTALNEEMEGHLVNTLVEEAQAQGETVIKENPEASDMMPSGTGSTQSDFDFGTENTTAAQNQDSHSSSATTSEVPQSTNISQLVTQSPTMPAPPTNREPLTITSSTTPGSVQPSSVRTSQAAKTSRIPLWQLLSQSSPSRPVNTSPSTPLTPSVAVTLAADSVTPLTSATPPLQSTSIEPSLALDESSVATLTPPPPQNESTQVSVIPDESDLSPPLDIDDPDDILTRPMKSETEHFVHNNTKPPILATEATEPPFVDRPELDTGGETFQNITNQDSNIDTFFTPRPGQQTSLDNNSTVDVDNTLDGTHSNIFPGANTPDNKTQHGNGIFDDPKVGENDPLLAPAHVENDTVVNPTEVLVTPDPTVSVTWTPIIDGTKSDLIPTSSTSLVPDATTVVPQASLEILTGFTPIMSTTQTTPVSQIEAVRGGRPTSASPASTVDFVASSTTTTITTSAPAPDLSTQSAPSSTLTASLAPTAVHKTDITDDLIPSLSPQPVQPQDGGERPTHEEIPEREAASEFETEPPPPAVTPPPSPALPDTTTTTTTTTTSSTTSSTTTTTTTTTTEKVPVTDASTEKPTTAAPDTTTAFISPVPAMNKTTAAPGEMPTLTTMTVLENGTEVVRELPYIRALVDYDIWEFCQHKHEFQSMFAEWITQNLNDTVKVAHKDIKFFAMAECPSSRDDLPMNLEDGGSQDAMMREQNHTHVYFYVTSDGEVNQELTEKFPLFPTDLEISEELTYLVPRVMQLELVRPDESSSQDHLQEASVGTSVIVIIVICSIVGVTIIVAVFFFLVVKRPGAGNNYYGRRCTPVSMDAYSMDSVSVYHSFRRKSKRRASGRSMKSYLNQAFDDPNGPSRPLNFAKLTHFISDIDGVYEEFATIPVNMPKYDELPAGVEDKNRYANVIPVPETRVLLKVTKDGRNCEYINANFVRGARNESKYYIATQAPLDDTVADFWRMIWEQETRVVVMLTDFVEKGIDKCADYLPPSETLDCHRLYGDFQVTLKSRDMREKFVVSHVQLKNLENNLMREVAHMWFTGWPASGVPNEEGAFISFILEVRRTRKKLRAKSPIVVHCSPGTGRTGTLLASDIVMKQFEEHRTIDVPRTVYAIRRDRAGAVQTKEQYAFIYRVINLYASKLTSGNLESL